MDAKKMVAIGALIAGAFLLSRRANAATPAAATGSSSVLGVGSGSSSTGAAAPSLSSTLDSVLKAFASPAPAPSLTQPTSSPVVTTSPAVASAATATPTTPTQWHVDQGVLVAGPTSNWASYDPV